MNQPIFTLIFHCINLSNGKYGSSNQCYWHTQFQYQVLSRDFGKEGKSKRRGNKKLRNFRESLRVRSREIRRQKRTKLIEITYYSQHDEHL